MFPEPAICWLRVTWTDLRRGSLLGDSWTENLPTFLFPRRREGGGRRFRTKGGFHAGPYDLYIKFKYTLFYKEKKRKSEERELKKYWLLVSSSLLLQVRRGRQWPAVLLWTTCDHLFLMIIHFWESREATIIFSVRSHVPDARYPTFLSSSFIFSRDIFH